MNVELPSFHVFMEAFALPPSSFEWTTLERAFYQQLQSEDSFLRKSVVAEARMFSDQYTGVWTESFVDACFALPSSESKRLFVESSTAFRMTSERASALLVRGEYGDVDGLKRVVRHPGFASLQLTPELRRDAFQAGLRDVVNHPSFTLTDREAVEILKTEALNPSYVLAAALSLHDDPRFFFQQPTFQSCAASPWSHVRDATLLNPRYAPKRRLAFHPGYEVLLTRMDLKVTPQELSHLLRNSSSVLLWLAVGRRPNFLPTEREEAHVHTSHFSQAVADLFASRRDEWAALRESTRLKTRLGVSSAAKKCGAVPAL